MPNYDGLGPFPTGVSAYPTFTAVSFADGSIAVAIVSLGAAPPRDAPTRRRRTEGGHGEGTASSVPLQSE